ncbi:MAG: PIN domain nuclease [Nitrospiraceae bacterium]|nr:PIN domain nuclease [Nitrospiraceae bacterium]
MILVDTSVWIDFLNGANSRERHTLHRLIEEEEDISITEIILTEVLQGIKEDKDFIAVRDPLMEFPIRAPKGIETYLKAAGIYRDCRKKGKTIRKTVDCVIAAICIENNLLLFHKDGDFDRIRQCTGLKVLRA